MAKQRKSKTESVTVRSYGGVALPHLRLLVDRNEKAMARVSARLARDVRGGKSLFVFGSGHSGLFAMELYHRAGGASFVIPVVGDFLLPSAGPSVVRALERTSGVATPLLERAGARRGEMLWLMSQSGINGATVDLALEARKRGLHTVAFTSVVHSRAVPSRHASKRKLFEICDEVIDLGGKVGDASVPLGRGVSAGPLSTIGAVLMGHSILVAACAALEKSGRRCVYTSVNTPAGEARNRAIEQHARKRDFLLR